MLICDSGVGFRDVQLDKNVTIIFICLSVEAVAEMSDKHWLPNHTVGVPDRPFYLLFYSLILEFSTYYSFHFAYYSFGVTYYSYL